MSSATARRLLQATNASREQRDFFEAFLALVFAEVEAAMGNRGAEALILSNIDLTRVEVQVTSGTPLMTQLASRFLRQCGATDVSEADRFTSDVADLRVGRATLYCRIKRIGSSTPVADAGFLVDASISKRFSDTHVTQSDDYLSLVRHSVDENCQPCLYGRSIMPNRGGSSPSILEFNMDKVTASKLLLSGLGFFRCLGFSKPADDVVRQLSHCKDKCMVRAFLTAGGLTQLSLRLFGSTRLPVGDTIRAMGIEQQSAGTLREVFGVLGDNPDYMEYAMDANGPALALGYVYPSSKE